MRDCNCGAYDTFNDCGFIKIARWRNERIYISSWCDLNSYSRIGFMRGWKMKCMLCPCCVENSNEIDGYQPNGCFYGDDYLDNYCYEDKDGDYCCDKTKEEIENEMAEYQENMKNEMSLLAEEMEKQWIANYDFERGDVKY